MSAPRLHRLAISLPTDRADDADYQQLIAMLRRSALASRAGQTTREIVTLVASWPDDAEHAALTLVAERLHSRFGGMLDGRSRQLERQGRRQSQTIAVGPAQRSHRAAGFPHASFGVCALDASAGRSLAANWDVQRTG